MIAVEEASKHASQVPLNICGARSPSLAHLQVEASLYQRAFLAMSHFHAHAQPLICVYSAVLYLLYTSSVYSKGIGHPLCSFLTAPTVKGLQLEFNHI